MKNQGKIHLIYMKFIIFHSEQPLQLDTRFIDSIFPFLNSIDLKESSNFQSILFQVHKQIQSENTQS